MPKFRAKTDTFYRFSYIRKGEEINGGAELYNSPNFEDLEPNKAPAAPKANAAQGTKANAEPAAPNYQQLCLIAKELKITGYNRMTYPVLLEKVAEAQAAAAAPTVESGEGDQNAGDGKKPEAGQDDNVGGESTGDEVKTENAGDGNTGE